MGERIDVYDSSRRRTGIIVDRATVFLKKGQYMLYVLAILENENGRILITRRAADKRWAAGSWEIPGGGARQGESSLDAVRREVLEETGVDVSAIQAEPVDGYVNEDLQRGDNYFVDIYHFRLPFREEDVRLEREEASAFRLATLEEIGNIAKGDGFLHYSRILHALERERQELGNHLEDAGKEQGRPC